MSKLIGMIHMAKARLGMDDETYRMFLVDTIGKNSLRDTNAREQWRVMEELKRRGFAPQAIHKGARLVDDPQAKKIRALWLTMADCGIVRDRSEKALENYVRRITGVRLGQATVKQCQTVIETLKAWLDRCNDPRIRAICRAILEQAEDAPAVLHGKTVVEARHGNLQ